MMRNTREALAATGTPPSTDETKAPLTAAWHTTLALTPTLVARTDAAACTIGTPSSRFIICGGQGNDKRPLPTTEWVEWTLGRSWRVAPLQQGRIGCGVAYLNNAIYCIGGLSQDAETELPIVLDSVEQLSTSPAPTGAWQVLPDTSALHTPRWGSAVVALSARNCLFVVGGRDAAWNEMSSVEVGIFDDDGTLQFAKLPYALKTKRFGATAVAVSPHAFLVVGGYSSDDDHWTDSCCIYDISENPDDPKDGQWRDVPSMPVPVDFPQAVVVESLAVIDGEGPHVVVSGSGGVCVQIFSLSRETWTVVEQHVPSTQYSLLLAAGRETIVAWGRDSVATLEWEAEPPVPPPTNSEPQVTITSTASNEKEAAAMQTENDVVDVQEVQAWPVNSSLSHSQMSNGSGTVTLGRSNASSSAIPPGGRQVTNEECLVEGEMARYTGPLNAQGQRHGRGFLIWADEQGRFWPKEVSKNSYYEGEFVQDSRSGRGIMFFDKEDRVYRGIFSRGVLNGPDGQLFDGRRGLEYTGCFKKGTPSGDGHCTYNSTKQTWKGTWKHGRPLVGEWRDAYGNLLQAGNGPWKGELAID